MIKAYRVQSTNKLTLVVEVISHPAAQFKWFCNDQLVDNNDPKFTINYGENITILTVFYFNICNKKVF